MWETTFRATAGSLHGLNIDRLPFNPLWGLTVVGRNDVLNGLSRALRSRPALTLPQLNVLLLQMGTLSEFEEGGNDGVADEEVGFGNSKMVVFKL